MITKKPAEMLAKTVRIAMLGAALVGAAGGAARAADDLPPALESMGGRRARPPGPWFVSVGPRLSLLRSSGYDPFSTNDVFAQFSATGLRTFATGPRLATAVGLQWESGSSKAEARGADTELSLSRVSAVFEERFV